MSSEAPDTSSCPQLSQYSDCEPDDTKILPTIADPDQGFEEPDSASSPSATSTDFDSAEEESVACSRRPSQFSTTSDSPGEAAACGVVGETADFEYKLNEAMIAFRHLINNEYVEGFRLFCEMSDVSLYHLMGKISVMTAVDLTNFKKHRTLKTLQAIQTGYQLINQNRKKRSATSTVTGFFHTVYNDYTDVQCHAELVFAVICALDAVCIVMNDQSMTGAIRGALKINVAHRTFKDCERILLKKNNWTTTESRDHFASGVNIGLGCFEMVISFFPHKFIRLLEFAGYSGDRAAGVEHMKKCEAIRNGFMHPWVSCLLPLYYGFLEYFFGLGEPDVDCLRRIHDHYSKVAPKSIAVIFGSAFFAQIKGDFDQAIGHYEDFVAGQSIVKSIHNLSYWQQIWLHAVDCNWEAAAMLTKKMVDGSWKVSPALFSYLYACLLSMMAEDGRHELRQEAAHYLKQVPQLKRNFGGKRAFHEKLVIEKSKQFADRLDKFVMPILDLMYIWNGFTLASYKQSCLPKLMGKIEEHLGRIDKDQDLDSYSRLTFMKGVCLAHGKAPLRSMDPFHDVLDFDKFVLHDRNLAPQACFEIGLVYRRMGDAAEAKKWLMKCKNYHNYITETMINFRSQLAMQSLSDE